MADLKISHNRNGNLGLKMNPLMSVGKNDAHFVASTFPLTNLFYPNVCTMYKHSNVSSETLQFVFESFKLKHFSLANRKDTWIFARLSTW